MIETYDEPGVAQIVRCIRSGQNAQAIVKHMRTKTDHAGLDMQRYALQTFLINLAHSTGSLREIVRLAVSISAPGNGVQVPAPGVFKGLCNRIVLFSYMEDMLRPLPRASRAPSLLLGSIGSSVTESLNHDARHMASSQNVADRDPANISDMPPCPVSAAPWTTLTADDDAVSHLVSLFLIWINPTWRFVEVDVFLYGNQPLNGPFPSPKL